MSLEIPDVPGFEVDFAFEVDDGDFDAEEFRQGIHEPGVGWDVDVVVSSKPV